MGLFLVAQGLCDAFQYAGSRLCKARAQLMGRASTCRLGVMCHAAYLLREGAHGAGNLASSIGAGAARMGKQLFELCLDVSRALLCDFIHGVEKILFDLLQVVECSLQFLVAEIVVAGSE